MQLTKNNQFFYHKTVKINLVFTKKLFLPNSSYTFFPRVMYNTRMA